MISRGLLDAAKQLSSMPRGSSPSTSAPKKSILDFTKDFQENLIGKGITVCRETEAEVKARTESNYRLKNELEGFTQLLAEIKFPSQDTLSNIDEDNKELMNKLDIMQREQVNVKESERKLETATDSASAGATIGEAGQLLLSVEKTASEITQLLQENDRRRDDLRQDTLRIKGTYADAMKALGRIIEELEGEDSVVNITVTDLRSPHSRLRGDAQREIFAVMTFEGTLRVAPVKIEPNNEVSVPHLDEGVLPPRCFVIELESLMPGGSPSPPPSTPPPMGFLDLAYGSTPLGRVVIRITTKGLKGRNFLYMCAGGMGGPSYAHSRVSYVGKKDEAGEWILLGNYVSFGGRGTSTRAVLSSREEDWESAKESDETYEVTREKAGEVRGDISYERASEFCIVTRDDNDRKYRTRNCFGVVEEGLNVLTTTISKYYQDIGNVHISQCGLIL
ncbi:uncharacterized protein LOC135204701 [Macrobrachium nipponense]|uniref:uncharacterized protein LOC135204701 n=1 Tax=Macrobrachium nipponense TaxID=159736 RepID=UPI0030C882C5